MKNIIKIISSMTLLFSLTLGAQDYVVSSPSTSIKVVISVSDSLRYAVYYNDQIQIKPSAFAIDFLEGGTIGKSPVFKKKKQGAVSRIVKPLYGNNTHIQESYNFLKIDFKGGYSLETRVFDNGTAMRFLTKFKKDQKVQKEVFDINFSDDYKIYASHPLHNSFLNSYEEVYKETNLQKLSDSLIMLPILIESKDVKMVVTESDLYDYSALYFLKSKTENGLYTTHPKYPIETKIGGHREFNLIVEKTAEYIAKVKGKRSFPWRIIVIEKEDKDLLSNDLVYLLNREQNSYDDFSWVKPGKVQWDWWNANNLKGVSFKSGINTETYKYFIDFAVKHKIEYVNIDEGWSNQYDLSNYVDFNAALDVRAVIDYAKSKDVGVFLWCISRVLDDNMEEFMKNVSLWGVKGLKIDFMDRDDQLMVDFYERAAKTAAKYKLMLNFHGAYKPTGMHREYPNIISHEAVRGLEYNKFEAPDGTTPEHALRIPFIRGIAGYMDYTPGAMTNAQKENFAVLFSTPMSQGTRSHQLAMYVIYESALVMLADSPSKYEDEPEAMSFLSRVPVTWDKTLPLMGKIGDYVVMAKKKGNTWWVAGMTDGASREVEVSFDFLEGGDFEATIISDGINAGRVGEDFILKKELITKASKRTFNMAPGGGFILQIDEIQ